MEKYHEYLQQAEKKIKTADHLIYMTFPIVQDKKMFLTVLSEINNAVLLIINSILQHDYIYKQIELSKDAKTNFRTFTTKCAQSYNINDNELRIIIEILSLAEAHRKSAMEFLKNDKVIILSDTLQPQTLSLERIKEFLVVTKEIFLKTSQKLIKNSTYQ